MIFTTTKAKTTRINVPSFTPILTESTLLGHYFVCMSVP